MFLATLEPIWCVSLHWEHDSLAELSDSQEPAPAPVGYVSLLEIGFRLPEAQTAVHSQRSVFEQNATAQDCPVLACMTGGESAARNAGTCPSVVTACAGEPLLLVAVNMAFCASNRTGLPLHLPRHFLPVLACMTGGETVAHNAGTCPSVVTACAESLCALSLQTWPGRMV